MQMLRLPLLLTVACLLSTGPNANAQANLLIYTDHLVNGFQDWSWAPRNMGSTFVHTGTNSIAVTNSSFFQGISFHQNAFNTSVYTNLSFWANGGTNGGQTLDVYVSLSDVDQTLHYNLPSALPANAWQQYLVPLTSLNAANKTNLTRITIRLIGGNTTTFFLDDIQLTANPAPATVNISLNATQNLRSVDFRMFGLNTAIWDGNFDTAQTVSLLKEVGATILRFPGGSLSDEYHWGSNSSVTHPSPWQTSFANFTHVATNVGVQAFITVNYGTSAAAEAAGWVRHSNVTNHFGFKYWEVGNENYGTWETDWNTNAPYRANDGWSYATRFQDYYNQMKAADPTIKVGIVVAPGQDSYVNGNTTHPATNSFTGQPHYGWTPLVLATLKSLGITPDFAVNHRYPEYTGSGFQPNCPDSDPLLLQTARAWADDAADLRQQVAAYFGPTGTNIELVVTENNADAGNQGRQSVSLVNGLYYAESLAQVMKTEFNSFVWWDLRNGSDPNGSTDSTLYGWRTTGDLGMVGGGLSTRYPAFYAAKLMQSFARPGDFILNASSDYSLLSAYAARRASGAISLLVANRDTVTNLNGQIALNGFVPGSSATLRSYGIPQDEATRTNGPAAAKDIATNSFAGAASTFSYNFQPLSLNLFTLSPSVPTLTALSGQPPGQFVFQLNGQSNVRYYIQNSTNLATWITVATNTLSSNTLLITNPIPPASARQFWRAVWLP
jgi:alpha-N-arabinofuranosidase